MLDVEKRSSAKVNVLLVDDQRANLLALDAVLDDLGQNLVHAQSGDEALALLAKDDFAVVLLDVQMYGLDGFETAKLIRALERSQHTPIIFLTGYDDSRFSAETAYTLGAVDYLVKPLVPVILRAKVMGFVELFHKTEQVKVQAERLRQMERREFEQRLAEENARLGEQRELLWQSEERYRAVSELTSDFAYAARLVSGYQLFIDWITEAVVRVTGFTLDEINERGWQSIIHPEDVPAALEVVQTVLSGQATAIEQRILTKTGQVRWIRNFVRPMPAAPGAAIAGFYGAAQDVTERKQAEQERSQRAEEFRRANQAKDEFLAMLGHELRNPLAPIRNALEVLRIHGGDASARWAEDVIDRQVQHMTRMVDDLLDVSRVTHGMIELRKELVDVAEVVARAVETSRPALDTRRHEFTVRCWPRAVLVNADPVRLGQVLSNLLNNAAKYTNEGGRICMGVECAAGTVTITVQDTGIGIAHDMLPRIFDLFAQADRSLARSQGGLGIGLTLARRIMELHGGTIEARSEGPGHGSTFVVRLPGTERAAEAGIEAPGPTAPSCQRRILLVDDNVDAAETLEMVLRLQGHAVKVVHDGPAALKAARGFHPEVVLLDIGLPGMSGYEVATQLRAQAEGKDALLVALTGYGQSEDQERSRAAGFDHHLVKPVAAGTLRELIEAS